MGGSDICYFGFRMASFAIHQTAACQVRNLRYLLVTKFSVMNIKRFIAVLFLVAGLTFVAFASFSTEKKKAKKENKVEKKEMKKEKKKNCKRTCMFS